MSKAPTTATDATVRPATPNPIAEAAPAPTPNLPAKLDAPAANLCPPIRPIASAVGKAPAS